MSPSPPRRSTPAALPLSGIKVLDLTRALAGPFCTMVLGDLGADVIKVEPVGEGDMIRAWGPFDRGVSAYYLSANRNKRGIAVNFRHPSGLALLRSMAAQCDVVAENFRPGAMEGWGLGPDRLLEANPRLIVLRISGYGQTGPYRDRPGFGVVAEAMGGLRHLTGEPGRVPVRVGVSIGDTLAALHGTIGVLMALYHRKVHGGPGQVIDMALHEAVFNVMESLLPEYSAFGVVREAAGSALPGIAPSNAYACSDGYVLIAGNGDSIFRRLMNAIGRPDLGAAADLQSNAGRAARVGELDAAIGAWTQGRSIAEVLQVLGAVAVPAGRVYTARDIHQDPHYRARDMILRQITRDGHELDVPGIVPKLSATPGAVRSPAPRLGEDTDAVLRELGLSPEQIAALRAKGIVA